ncbi:MAG TPA: hypothetical protein VLZ74_12700 [Methylocella sp.]|nr:hypothetical protein [Methylocella sp.]
MQGDKDGSRSPDEDAAGRGFHHEMTLTERGLVLGAGTLLAKMDGGGLHLEGEEERVLTLLAIAHGGNVRVRCWAPFAARQNIGAAATNALPRFISRKVACASSMRQAPIAWHSRRN